MFLTQHRGIECDVAFLCWRTVKQLLTPLTHGDSM